MPEQRGAQIIEKATEARQGVTGHNVRYVLAFGLVGVIILFAIAYFSFFH
jgi:hypothetical protein